MRYLIFCGFLLLTGFAEVRAEDIGQHNQEYLQAGKKDAEKLRGQFEEMDKPAYQKAYADYQQDLEWIAAYGVAPDNEALYDDLRAMNSDEEFIYSKTERDNRFNYRRYNY